MQTQIERVHSECNGPQGISYGAQWPHTTPLRSSAGKLVVQHYSVFFHVAQLPRRSQPNCRCLCERGSRQANRHMRARDTDSGSKRDAIMATYVMLSPFSMMRPAETKGTRLRCKQRQTKNDHVVRVLHETVIGLHKGHPCSQTLLPRGAHNTCYTHTSTVQAACRFSGHARRAVATPKNAHHRPSVRAVRAVWCSGVCSSTIKGVCARVGWDGVQQMPPSLSTQAQPG